jgi:transcription termination factor Rho
MNIEENANNYIPKEEEVINNENLGNVQEGKKTNSIFNMLKSETGEGTIQSYNNHPLNAKNNNSISQIIRGLTGILGSLNFGILDVILGCLGYVKEKKDNSSNDNSMNANNKIYTSKDNPIKDTPSVVNGIRNV